jgi:hypothetical protein
MICRRTESNDILLELVAKTLAVGAYEMQVEYEDRKEHVLAFQEGLALVSPAWMRAVKRRKLCERRCIRSGESKRLSPSRGLSTGYGHEFTNRSEKMYSESQSRKAERRPPMDCTVRLWGDRCPTKSDLEIGIE